MNNINTPKVSILIPVYNGSNYLNEAIDSAIQQTYPNVEIIVINDGSNDDGKTDQIAKSYGQRIRYFEKPNGGVASALNYGISFMEGDYFSWLSHDDVYEPTKIEKQVALLHYLSWDSIIYCDTKITDSSGVVLYSTEQGVEPEESFILALLKKSFLNGCTLLIPKVLFEKYGNFDESLRTTQDYELWFRFLMNRVTFHRVPEPLVRSRQHVGQDSVAKAELCRIEADYLHYNVLKRINSDLLCKGKLAQGKAYLDLAGSFYSRNMPIAGKEAACVGFEILKKEFGYSYTQSLIAFMPLRTGFKFQAVLSKLLYRLPKVKLIIKRIINA